MKEVAIFGGTFDPPTKAHEGVVAACLRRPDLDEVWLMPSGARPDKPAMSSNAARLAMLGVMKEAVFQGDERLVVTDFEHHLVQPTRTCLTVQELETSHPNHRFWYVYGADSYHDMPNWEEGDQLRKRLGMLLVPRSGYELPGEGDTIRHLDLPAGLRSIASSEFREALRQASPVEAFVGQAVLNYIRQEALYGA